MVWLARAGYWSNGLTAVEGHSRVILRRLWHGNTEGIRLLLVFS